MSSEIILGLLLQATALLLVFRCLGRTWISHVGGVFVVVACVFHGVNEVAQWMFPGRNFYRDMMNPAFLDRWMVIVSSTILVSTLGYLQSLGTTRVAGDRTEDLLQGLPPWWVWAALSFPTFLLALQAQTLESPEWTTAQGLSVQFFQLFSLMACITYVYRRPQAAMPILVLQVALMFAAGSRGAAIAVTFCLLAAYVLSGVVQISWRRLALFGLVGAVFALMLSGAREELGRTDYLEASPIQRAQALFTSTDQIDQELILNQTVYRIDGNAFPTLVTEARNTWQPTDTGFTPFFNTLRLQIPTFIYSGKYGLSVADRSEKVYAQFHYGLPGGLDFRIDYLPMTLGVLHMYGGPTLLVILSTSSAFVMGKVDRWIQTRSTPYTLVILISMMLPAVIMERGVEVWAYSARGALTLLAAIFAGGVLSQMLKHRATRPPITGHSMHG